MSRAALPTARLICWGSSGLSSPLKCTTVKGSFLSPYLQRPQVSAAALAGASSHQKPANPQLVRLAAALGGLNTQHSVFISPQAPNSPAGHLEGIHPHRQLLGQAHLVEVHTALCTSLVQQGIPWLLFVDPYTPGKQRSAAGVQISLQRCRFCSCRAHPKSLVIASALLTC